MTDLEARSRAAVLGLSAWIEEEIAVGQDTSGVTAAKCVGFATIGLAIARAASWEDAFGQALRIIFSA